jgi:Ca2+-binding EF-hand superfamily protein
MKNLGYRNMTNDDVEKLIVEVDLNKNNLVEFSEFLKV